MKYACPNPECWWSDPRNLPADSPWYSSHGFYRTKQNGMVPRYMCRNCHRTFSLRTREFCWHLRDDSLDVGSICSEWLKGKSVGELAMEYGASKQKIRTRLKRIIRS